MPPDPLQLVDLTTARTDFEAEVLVHALNSEGIPAQAFTGVGSALGWEIAGTQPIRVQVRRCDLEKARLSLARVRQESVDYDWSELGAEEFDEVCRRCGYSLADLADKTVCPECGYAHPLGGEVGAVASASRGSSRGGRLRRNRLLILWLLVAVFVVPVLIAVARMVLLLP